MMTSPHEKRTDGNLYQKSCSLQFLPRRCAVIEWPDREEQYGRCLKLVLPANYYAVAEIIDSQMSARCRDTNNVISRCHVRKNRSGRLAWFFAYNQQFMTCFVGFSVVDFLLCVFVHIFPSLRPSGAAFS